MPTAPIRILLKSIYIFTQPLRHWPLLLGAAVSIALFIHAWRQHAWVSALVFSFENAYLLALRSLAQPLALRATAIRLAVRPGKRLAGAAPDGYGERMCITAIVENGTIKLPAGVHVPDGTKVEIMLPAAKESAAPQSFFDTIEDLVGSVDGLPDDFAAEHDHYIHGTPKRAQR
jgi:hypothetical protein